MKPLLITASALLVLLCFAAPAPAAYAQDSNYRDNIDPWQTRGAYEYHVYALKPLDWPNAHPSVPENCALTPAQADRYRCETMIYEGRPYYYYEDERGEVHVRRPITWVYSDPVVTH
jgi:hypothetical protein